MKKKCTERCEESEIRDGALGIGKEVWELNRIPSHLHFNFLQLTKAPSSASFFLCSWFHYLFFIPIFLSASTSFLSVTPHYCNTFFHPMTIVLRYSITLSPGKDIRNISKRNHIHSSECTLSQSVTAIWTVY